MTLRGLLLLAISAILQVAADDVKSTKTRYFCLGTDICNSGSNWQWCDEVLEKRCRDCSKIEHLCGRMEMPRNCTIHCLETALQKEKVKDCPPLRKVYNGNHNGTKGTKHGVPVILHCEAGYHCDGKCTTTCSDYGQYTNSLSCIENQCPALPFPIHGIYSPERSMYDVTDIINFTCAEGFTLDGSQSAKCTKNGTWNIDRYPACVPVEKGIRIKDWYIILAASVASIIWAVVAALCILWKCKSKEEIYPKNKKRRSSDKKNKDDETKSLTASDVTVDMDKEVLYANHGQSEPNLYFGPVNPGRGFGCRDSVSENHLPSWAGPGIDSGFSTTNPSTDSRLHVPQEPCEGKTNNSVVTVNVTVSNNPNITNTIQQNTTMPDNSDQSKDKEKKPEESMRKTPAHVHDNPPVEETGDGKKECRGEIQGEDLSDEEEGGEDCTIRKEVGERKSEAKPRIPVPEQHKCPPVDQFHAQPMDDTGTKQAMVAIGGNCINQADV